MDTKEEMIEEIEDIEMPEEDKQEIDTNDVFINQDINITEESKPEEIPVIEDLEEDKNIENSEIGANEPNEEKQIVEENVEETPKKNKTPLIVLLSILLVLDIAALVIYMIGIDKVISFIK